MLPVRNGTDDVIIVLAHIIELYSSSTYRRIDSDDPASGTSTIYLPRYKDVGLLAAPLLMMARLFKVVKHPHIQGL